MTKLVSEPTTITITSSVTPLFTAASTIPSNAFLEFAGNDLTTRSPHPVTGNSVNVLEDGRLSQGYQTLGYSGRGCYDPVSQRVMFTATGAGSNYPGAYVHNTQAIYSEATNAWTARRAFKAPEDGNANGIVHQYDGNALAAAARRYFKARSNANDGNGARVMQFDLDTNQWIANIAPPTNDNGNFWWVGLEIIPTRGSDGKGALWRFGQSNTGYALWELNLANVSTGWTQLKGAADFASSANSWGPTISYNSRAFGGTGGVMLAAGGRIYTIRADNLQMSSVELPPTGYSVEIDPGGGYNSGFCRDPAGAGWLQFSNRDARVYRFNGNAWETRAAMPSPGFSAGAIENFIVVPIDAYGVAWLISYNGGAPRAWLYRP